jgi:hypothetical protein
MEKELATYIESTEAGEFLSVKSIRGSSDTVLISYGSAKLAVKIEELVECINAIKDFNTTLEH